MQEKYNDATANRPNGNRLIDASLIGIDINDYIQQLKDEEAWQKNDRNAITLFKTDNMRIVLAAFHENATMPGNTTSGTISLQVLEGKVKISSGLGQIDVGEKQMAALHGEVPYSITAVEESVFLLTIAVIKTPGTL
ncbi:MAG: hypothetical protein BGO69_13115 [Bacteroidetes bacterium 46-16]|nr:MAG: hypothetical protein BGO69_13115 [Bacteroidetes bacterium 46-16]